MCSTFFFLYNFSRRLIIISRTKSIISNRTVCFNRTIQKSYSETDGMQRNDRTSTLFFGPKYNSGEWYDTILITRKRVVFATLGRIPYLPPRRGQRVLVINTNTVFILKTSHTFRPAFTDVYDIISACLICEHGKCITRTRLLGEEHTVIGEQTTRKVWACVYVFMVIQVLVPTQIYVCKCTYIAYSVYLCV